MVVGELASSRVPYPEPEPAAEEVLEEAPEEEEDDRVSVDSPAAVLIEGPPAVDTDGLEDKTKKELHDILTKRGIPFSKSDNKNALISLLKATS